jgi:hypothetical protein
MQLKMKALAKMIYLDSPLDAHILSERSYCYGLRYSYLTSGRARDRLRRIDWGVYGGFVCVQPPKKASRWVRCNSLVLTTVAIRKTRAKNSRTMDGMYTGSKIFMIKIITNTAGIALECEQKNNSLRCSHPSSITTTDKSIAAKPRSGHLNILHSVSI